MVHMNPSQRQAQLARLNDLHHAWSLEWSGLPVPERGEGSDVALHHIDASEHADASDDFVRRVDG